MAEMHDVGPDLGPISAYYLINEALLRASIDGDKDAVQLLIDRGANIERADVDGWTALLLAAYYGHKDVIQLLIDQGASYSTKRHAGFERARGERRCQRQCRSCEGREKKPGQPRTHFHCYQQPYPEDR